ncbi:Hypothetical_protein [Hexamita inflata]|uniref:Hypothetical_protein n=1 Tax=Hexamita inflata TaxID=28002 RepID=A0AA86UTH3_9EUKA|nr:Hypothetical protein HINF_LOCUS51872 [Hexamita inflata]
MFYMTVSAKIHTTLALIEGARFAFAAFSVSIYNIRLNVGYFNKVVNFQQLLNRKTMRNFATFYCIIFYLIKVQLIYACLKLQTMLSLALQAQSSTTKALMG